MTLRNKTRETDLQIKQHLDSFSPSLCLAKWYNATIWLGSGQTTSCHHPPAHQISVSDIGRNPKAIHNTKEKKEQRSQMLRGERPAGCDYCWKIEDIDSEKISDRVYKSVIYNDDDLEFAVGQNPNNDFDLKTLEIAFDRTCNFACSYCNPAFSSEWVKDIKNNGPYSNLKSDGRNHFTHAHDSAQPFKLDEENPYVEAFFKWWESDLHKTLFELRLTGGEPLMSPYTWRLFDWFIQHKSKMRFAINSNLGAKDSLIDKLIETSHAIEDFHLYTSNESMYEHAEYIRDGLIWDQWDKNVNRIIEEGNIKGFHMMCTINALCLESLPDFLDYLLDLKRKYGKDFPTFTLNILRFPSFQSPLVLPLELRGFFRKRLYDWLVANQNNDLLHQMEINQVNRLIDYLDVVKTPHNNVFDIESLLHNDFYHFYKQYDERRRKNFTETFSQIASWYRSLK
jgi:organic radical activating enzyme